MSISIKDRTGRVIQVQETRGSRTYARTPSGLTLGWYDPRTDSTYSATGAKLTSGNTLAALS